jgi:glutathione S-transferase
MPRARLITIPLSHYCEKARWALDYARVPYTEEGHAPIAHVRATRPVGGKSVPVLVDGDTVLRDSTDIVIHADRNAPEGRRLLPTDPTARGRVLRLENELDETLGIDARRLVYWHELGDTAHARALAGRMFRTDSSLVQTLAAPPFRALIFRLYGVNAGTAERAASRLRATFASIGETLGERAYLEGDTFGLADLTFASLATLVLWPAEHPVIGPAHRTQSPGLAALREEVAATRAGQHALRMYREHRHA